MLLLLLSHRLSLLSLWLSELLLLLWGRGGPGLLLEPPGLLLLLLLLKVSLKVLSLKVGWRGWGHWLLRSLGLDGLLHLLGVKPGLLLLGPS